jgi:hypothetical protein
VAPERGEVALEGISASSAARCEREEEDEDEKGKVIGARFGASGWSGRPTLRLEEAAGA